MPNEAVIKALTEMHSANSTMLNLVTALLLKDVSEERTVRLIKPIKDALAEASAAIRAIDLTKPVEG